ncbi:MAG: hypothetical protein ACI4EW_07425 [Butyrivibrio sp.]
MKKRKSLIIIIAATVILLMVGIFFIVKSNISRKISLNSDGYIFDCYTGECTGTVKLAIDGKTDKTGSNRFFTGTVTIGNIKSKLDNAMVSETGNGDCSIVCTVETEGIYEKYDRIIMSVIFKNMDAENCAICFSPYYDNGSMTDYCIIGGTDSGEDAALRYKDYAKSIEEVRKQLSHLSRMVIDTTMLGEIVNDEGQIIGETDVTLKADLNQYKLSEADTEHYVYDGIVEMFDTTIMRESCEAIINNNSNEEPEFNFKGGTDDIILTMKGYPALSDVLVFYPDESILPEKYKGCYVTVENRFFMELQAGQIKKHWLAYKFDRDSAKMTGTSDIVLSGTVVSKAGEEEERAFYFSGSINIDGNKVQTDENELLKTDNGYYILKIPKAVKGIYTDIYLTDILVMMDNPRMDNCIIGFSSIYDGTDLSNCYIIAGASDEKSAGEKYNAFKEEFEEEYTYVQNQEIPVIDTTISGEIVNDEGQIVGTTDVTLKADLNHYKLSEVDTEYYLYDGIVEIFDTTIMRESCEARTYNNSNEEPEFNFKGGTENIILTMKGYPVKGETITMYPAESILPDEYKGCHVIFDIK